MTHTKKGQFAISPVIRSFKSLKGAIKQIDFTTLALAGAALVIVAATVLSTLY